LTYIITTKDQLDEMILFYSKQDAFAFDVETVGVRREVPAVNEVLWLSFATHGRGDVIPLGHPNGEFVSETYPLTGQGEKRVLEGLSARKSDYSRNKKKAVKTFSEAPKQLYPAEVFKALEPLFFNNSILKIGHNLGFDLSSVAKYYNSQVPSGPYFDTLMASFLYDNRNKLKLGLDDCLQRELGFHMEKGIGHKVEEYGFSEVAKYSYLDAKYTFLLWKHLAPKLIDSKTEEVMNLEMGVLRVLCEMKLTGASIDTDLLSVLHTQLSNEVEEVKKDIYRIGGVFNINSNAEKQYLLYGPKEEGCRGLKPTVLTGKGEKKEGAKTYKDYSVSAEALEDFRDTDELVDALLKYSDLNKLLSTYVVPYLGGEVIKTTNNKSKVEYKDSLLVKGKIYADFIQWGAETGRFSSRNPNLQNVPAPNTEHGRAIRNLFYAPEGYKLVVADYSQIEPRVIASMSEDEIMINNYLEKRDIYTTVGEEMGVDRKAGKVLVLSIAYGVGPEKIANQIGCTPKEAKELLTRFAEKFPSVGDYRQLVIGVARKYGYVSTLFKRRRYLPDINSRNIGFRASAERQAFNTRIQGSAADIIKLAMIRAYERLPKESRLILTVHDELVTLTPDNLVDQTKEAILDAMENINLLKVPLVADLAVVQRWGEAK